MAGLYCFFFQFSFSPSLLRSFILPPSLSFLLIFFTLLSHFSLPSPPFYRLAYFFLLSPFSFPSPSPSSIHSPLFVSLNSPFLHPFSDLLSFSRLSASFLIAYFSVLFPLSFLFPFSSIHSFCFISLSSHLSFSCLFPSFLLLSPISFPHLFFLFKIPN